VGLGSWSAGDFQSGTLESRFAQDGQGQRCGVTTTATFRSIIQAHGGSCLATRPEYNPTPYRLHSRAALRAAARALYEPGSRRLLHRDVPRAAPRALYNPTPQRLYPRDAPRADPRSLYKGRAALVPGINRKPAEGRAVSHERAAPCRPLAWNKPQPHSGGRKEAR
jgi:hypothetical protein